MVTLNSGGGGVDIAGNASGGVMIEPGSGLIANGVTNTINIHGNRAAGIQADAAVVQLSGTVTVQDNLGAGLGLNLAAAGLGPGVQIVNNTGGGVIGQLQSKVVLGDEQSPSSGVTVTGNTFNGSPAGVDLAQGSLAMSLSANTISSMTCDATSWKVGSFAPSGNSCPSDQPSGGVGPQGPAGPAGVTGPAGPQGPQGEAGAEGAVGATGPVGPAGPEGPSGAQGPEGVTGTAGAPGPQGPQGATGAAGATGATGPAGPTGPIGPSGVSGFATVQTQTTQTIAKNGSFTQTATCAAGKIALGGGGSTANVNLTILSSLPTAAGTGWSVRFQNNSSGVQTGVLNATVLCAIVTP